MARRNRPTVPKRANLLDYLIYKAEKWLYEQENALDDAKTKSQIFNNMANVREKRSRIALNKAKLKRVELQNRLLEKALEDNNVPLLPDPNLSFCSSCESHHPLNRTICTCGYPLMPVFLDDIEIGENYGKQ